MHDEPFWRGSNEVKRIARYQREFRTGPGLHNLGVFRIHNFRRVDHVFVRSAYGCEVNAVACHYPFEFAEKRVPVRCDRDVAVCAGQRSPRYMPGSDDQGIVLNALEDHHRNTDSGNLELADNLTLAKTGRFFHNGRFDDFWRGGLMLEDSRYRAHACALEVLRCRGYECALELPRLVTLIDDSRRGRSTGVDQGGYTKQQKQSMSKAQY